MTFSPSRKHVDELGYGLGDQFCALFVEQPHGTDSTLCDQRHFVFGSQASPVASCSATARFPKVDRCDIFAKPMDSTPYRVRVLLHVDSGRFRFSPTTDCAFHAIIALASSA